MIACSQIEESRMKALMNKVQIAQKQKRLSETYYILNTHF